AYKRKFSGRILDGKWHFEYYRIAFRVQSSRSNQRTFISTIIPPGCATGNSINTLVSNDYVETLLLSSFLCSFANDFNIRTKITSNINSFYVSQLFTPKFECEPSISKVLVMNTLKLVCTSCIFEPLYNEVALK